jgi:hypothetical protein
MSSAIERGDRVVLNNDLTRYDPAWKRGERGVASRFIESGYGSDFYWVKFDNGSSGKILTSSLDLEKDYDKENAQRNVGVASAGDGLQASE